MPVHTFTFCHSLSSSPKVKRRMPYLLHRSSDDHVPHWNEDSSKDGQQRPDHSPDDQPASRATASHGGVRFPPSRLHVCLSASPPAWQPVLLLSRRLQSVLVFAARQCLCPGSSGAGRLYHLRIRRSNRGPGKGTEALRNLP